MPARFQRTLQQADGFVFLRRGLAHSLADMLLLIGLLLLKLPYRLTDIALLIRKYVGEGHPTIGCFSRITDIRNKTVEELQQLHHLGFDYLTIGVESGDSETLTRVNKGYLSEDIVEQCRKLEEADTHYHFFYLVGLGGHGNGERNAKAELSEEQLKVIVTA